MNTDTRRFNTRTFILVTLITSIWVHASETFRYFLFVIPVMQEYLSGVEHVASMSVSIFAIWGLWDTLLTGLVVFLHWLYTERFGRTIRSAVVAGIISWLFFFVLFWVGMWNMGLSSSGLLGITLPLSLLEMVLACLFAHYLYNTKWFRETVVA